MSYRMYVLPSHHLLRSVLDILPFPAIIHRTTSCQAVLDRGIRCNAPRAFNSRYRSLLYKIQQYQLSPYSQRLTG
jgi:hypothetical protein